MNPAAVYMMLPMRSGWSFCGLCLRSSCGGGGLGDELVGVVGWGAFLVWLTIVGHVMRCHFESLGCRKEFVVVELSFLVRCLVKHCLWEQSSSGCEVELVEAGCWGTVCCGKSFRGRLIP